MTQQNTDVRARIIQATAELLAQGGREAVSTRAVSAAAGVQAPTIYRQFGDMKGLLDAVARESFAAYVRQKDVRETSDDPIEDLRRGWDLHVAFGLAHPAAYVLLRSNLTAVTDMAATREAEAILHDIVARVAAAGRLRVRVPHAVHLLTAAGSGVTLSLIATPPDARDLRLSASMREAVIAAISVAPSSGSAADQAPGRERVAARAVALHAVLAEAPGILSGAEQHLLSEWLDRLADTDA